MISCRESREWIDPYLDGELSPEDASSVEAHLSDCADCREERTATARVRDTLHVHWGALVAEAPPAPTELRAKLHPRSRRRRWGGWAAVAAVALGAIGGFAFWNPAPLDASPDALVQRAAERYLTRNDAELWVTVESEALDLLDKILDRDEDAGPDDRPVQFLRILVSAPDRFLVQSTEDLRNATWDSGDELWGFDGHVFWAFDPEKGTVEVTPKEHVDASWDADLEELGAGSGGLLTFLSWGFVRELVDEKHDRHVVERTGPYEERVGRRVFEVDLRKKKEDGKQYLTVRSRLIIDPRRDAIEKMTLDVNFGGLSLLTVTVELAEMDQGLVASFFEYGSHVPAETPVVEHEGERK